MVGSRSKVELKLAEIKIKPPVNNFAETSRDGFPILCNIWVINLHSHRKGERNGPGGRRREMDETEQKILITPELLGIFPWNVSTVTKISLELFLHVKVWCLKIFPSVNLDFLSSLPIYCPHFDSFFLGFFLIIFQIFFSSFSSPFSWNLISLKGCSPLDGVKPNFNIKSFVT